jgi:hypothetical protein
VEFAVLPGREQQNHFTPVTLFWELFQAIPAKWGIYLAGEQNSCQINRKCGKTLIKEHGRECWWACVAS